MKLIIKNMVCRHCVEVVRTEVERLGIAVRNVSLGLLETVDELSEGQLLQVEQKLTEEGFEIIVGREALLIEELKHLLIEESRREGGPSGKLQEIVSAHFTLSYPSVSRMFSAVEGRSLENYFISLRIEYVKELVKYGRETLSEIAYRTGFSSVAHLSAKFKSVTGLTPTQFRDIGERIPLPEV